ncbi:hypothetical protein PSTT_11481, partial [Puccinia striiformis]
KPASSPSTTRHLRKSKGASSNPTTPAPPTNQHVSYALQRGGQLVGSHGIVARWRSHDIRWKTFPGECKNRCGNVISDQFGYETCKGCGRAKSLDRREMNICTKESCRSLDSHVSIPAKHAPGCSTLVVPTGYSGHCDRCFEWMRNKGFSWACINQDCPYEVARQGFDTVAQSMVRHPP